MVTGLSLLVPYVALSADIIHLTDGTSFEGSFQSMDRGNLVFVTPDGRRVRIAGSRVKRIEISYSGLSACYVLREEPGQKRCDGILHSITPTRVILARENRRQQKEVIPLGDVKLLEFRKKKPRENVLPLLRRGIQVFLQLREGEVEGTVISVDAKRVVLRVPGGARRSISEDDLLGGVYRPPRVYATPVPAQLPPAAEAPALGLSRPSAVTGRIDPYDEVWNLWAFLPGFSHYRRGEFWYGTMYVATFVALAGAGAAEFQAAQSVNAEKNGSLTYLLFNDSSYQARFSQHQRNQRIIGGVAGVLYIVQLFHAGFFRLDSVPGGFGPQKTAARERPNWFLSVGRDHRARPVARAGVLLRF